MITAAILLARESARIVFRDKGRSNRRSRMQEFRRAWHPVRSPLVAGAMLALAVVPAAAQAIDCGRLRSQIVGLSHGDSGRASSYQRAAEKQRVEIDRTVGYSRSIGCDHSQFLFFGNAPPAQCPQINAQIARMQANLQSLQQAAAQAGGGGEDMRRELTLRYNTYCGEGAQSASASPPGRTRFLDFLFGNDAPDQQIQQQPIEPERPVQPRETTPTEARGGPKAVCVRSCDGAFFPVSYSARRDNLDELNDMCHALCPNAEVAVYTYSISRDISTAIAMDGAKYSELPNALKFEKKFDPTCTCRPPGKSWVETLADAEKMLGSVKTDVIVTQEKANEMSQPRPALVSKAKVTKTADAKAPPPVAPAAQPAPGDDPTAAEGVVAAQVPTASKESAGINAGDAASASVYGPKQGETREVTGPDGVKRRVRFVAPTL
jgi:hypothetical protein